jgi:hypothetical protein
MAKKAGQLVTHGSHTLLARVSLCRDSETWNISTSLDT